MQQIIKQVGPSRQLFETFNFAFMKIFDFLLKPAIFGAFLLFLGELCYKLWPKIERGDFIISSTELDFWPQFVIRITEEKQKGPQKGCFDQKIKNFHKSKVDGLKKLSTRAHLFYDFLHFRGCPFTKAQFSQGAIDGIHFFQLF